MVDVSVYHLIGEKRAGIVVVPPEPVEEESGIEIGRRGREEIHELD